MPCALTTLTLIPGGGIGPEVTGASVRMIYATGIRDAITAALGASSRECQCVLTRLSLHG